MATTSEQTLNAIRALASQTYQDRIPTATENNLDTIAAAFATYPTVMNEFLNLLVNRIAMVVVSSKMIQNPLAQLKKGKLPLGGNIQEIFTNPAIATEYKVDSTDRLKVTPPDVKALYYGVNRKDKYPVTIAEATILQAVCCDSDMNSLVNSIINSLYSGDNVDEFLLMKQLVADAVTKGNVLKREQTFNPANMTKTDAENFVKQLRTDCTILPFPSSSYNSYSKVKPVGDTGEDCITFTPTADQVLLIDAQVYANISVDVLASAFNLDKTNFLSRVIPVDNFNGEPIIAMLCDVAWFRVYDQQYRTASEFNPDTLNYHYYLHHWQVMMYSMFANAIAYTYVIPT